MSSPPKQSLPYQIHRLIVPDSIRILKLALEDWRDELKGSLIVVPLSTPLVDYDVLPYRWGSPEATGTHLLALEIGGAHSAYQLPITANRRRALRGLRDGFKERLPWVDSICINQNDLQEKRT